jgi:hypothetical protein
MLLVVRLRRRVVFEDVQVLVTPHERVVAVRAREHHVRPVGELKARTPFGSLKWARVIGSNPRGCTVSESTKTTTLMESNGTRASRSQATAMK